MEIGKLSKDIKDGYRGENASRHVHDFEGWIDQATAESDGASGYDHTETVKTYYDLCSGFMV